MTRKKIRAVISGAAGRMGKELVRAVAGSPDFQLVQALEVGNHPGQGKDAGLVAGIGALNLPIMSEQKFNPAFADVLIEFTFPEPTLRHLKTAARHKIPAVVGTTGFSGPQKAELAKLSKKMPVLVSPNMSVGVNLLFALSKKAAEVLGAGYDIEVIEAHHRQKQDAPSGTALRLAETLAEARGWDLDEVACYHRQGKTGVRPERQIGIQTIRAGDIVGEHTVILATIGERIELTHRASSRQILAQGALRAAGWILGKPPGLYSMGDCLKLK